MRWISWCATEEAQISNSKKEPYVVSTMKNTRWRCPFRAGCSLVGLAAIQSKIGARALWEEAGVYLGEVKRILRDRVMVEPDRAAQTR